MPVALRIGSYIFFFYSADRPEPPHIHVENNGREAKFWLTPVELERNQGYRQHELNRVTRMVEENLDTLLRKWHEYFGI